MTISWVTDDPCISSVNYGTRRDRLDYTAYGVETTYTFSYILNDPVEYRSGHIHHVLLDGLTPNTRYFYYCGGDIEVTSEFTTLPMGESEGGQRPMILGIIGDLGQTADSKSTIEHIIKDPHIDMILHAGDLSYADCNPSLWDSYGDMIEPLAKRVPWMVCAGNHEIEFNGTDYNGLYRAFESRYRMAWEKPAEFGDVIIPSAIRPSNGLPYCTPSIFQSEYNYGNSFYSFDAGLAHIIYLNPYSNTATTSIQYQWLVGDLAVTDRATTPWIIVIMHCPWYSSNKNHYGDEQTVKMRDSMEDLFYQYRVNMAFSGHVHAYERTWAVFRNITDIEGTTYITIGDGGNLEGHDQDYYDPPKWSAFRNGTQYGYGRVTVINRTDALWEWYIDAERKRSRDSVKIYNTLFLENT